jgi:hypothetical protein
MNEYDLKNASINIPYNDFNEIIKELNDLREFIRTTFWYCDTPEEIKSKACMLNKLYEYWL